MFNEFLLLGWRGVGSGIQEGGVGQVCSWAIHIEYGRDHHNTVVHYPSININKQNFKMFKNDLNFK